MSRSRSAGCLQYGLALQASRALCRPSGFLLLGSLATRRCSRWLGFNDCMSGLET
jgi:hypothetical protein